MAVMSEELKNHLHQLKIKSGRWMGPDGNEYKVCWQGRFIIHSITVTRIKQKELHRVPWSWKGTGDEYYKSININPEDWVRVVEYQPLRYHYGNSGGNMYEESFYTVEEFDKLFNDFMLGFKEYQALQKKTAIEDDFV